MKQEILGKKIKMTISNRIDYRNLAIVLVGIFISFIIIFGCIYPINYSNLGGIHSWLSGASLKFINQWLEEGALHNHFTCYETFDSIEFLTMEDRIPYISYPTGSTFMVYFAAKLLGVSHVGISFLKKFQCICFLIEALSLGTFIYVLLTDFDIKGCSRVLSAYFLTLTWMMLPVNIWYLANIYFADQAVMLYIISFLLLEYITGRNISVRQIRFANVLKALVAYAGTMTDYYFWILIFIAFVICFIKCLNLKQNLKNTICHIAWYIVPVIAALITFIWQLSFTDNWQGILVEKFLGRAGTLEGENVWQKIFENFYNTMSDFSIGRGILILYMEVMLVLLLFLYLKKTGNWIELITKIEYSILLTGFLAPILQIIILKQHSAIHEFSMIKIGWVLVMSVLVFTLLLFKLTQNINVYVGKKKISNYKWSFIVTLFVMLFAMGSPFNVNKFIDRCYAEALYPLEEILYATAEYEDVYFSFTYSIPSIPPQQLAVSEKQVYQISELKEINEIFPDLPAQANKMLIIDKKTEVKDPVIADTERQLLAENEITYEDDYYCILKLK